MNSSSKPRGMLAEGAREAGGGFLRLVFGLVAALVALFVFFGFGAGLGTWSPALLPLVLGVFGGLGLLIWRMARFAIAGGIGGLGGALSLLLGSGEGLGLKVALGAAAMALVALWFSLLQFLET
jgi:hypothetical protein